MILAWPFKCNRKSNCDKSESGDVININNDYMEAAAAAADISVPAELKPGVQLQLRRLAEMADLLMTFSLSESDEPITLPKFD